MHNARQHTSQSQQGAQAPEQYSVQGQPFPVSSYLPPLGLVPLPQQQQARPPASQLPGQVPMRPLAGQYFPPLSAQWANTAQMYQALRQQTVGATQSKPMLTASTAGMASATRPAPHTAKASEAGGRKYNKKRKVQETATAPAPPKAAPLLKERFLKSEQLSRMQDLDDKILRLIDQQKGLAHSTLHSSEHVRKKLRLYVQCEHPRPAQGGEESAEEPSFWKLSIWGKLMDAAEGLPNSPFKPQPGHHHVSKPLSAYLQRLALNFTEQDGSQSAEVAWSKSSHKGEARDRFHHRRQSNGQVKVNLQIEVDSQPQLYQLSEPVSQLMGCKLSTRTAVLQAFSTHFKMHNLQEGKSQIRCDASLKKIFDRERLDLDDLPNLLDPHLRPAEPYSLVYVIRPEGPASSGIACYDLDINVLSNSTDQQSVPILERAPVDPAIENLQQKINGLVTAATELNRRRELLLGFSNSPLETINSAIASQSRDLRAQKPGGQILALRRTQFFDGRWVDDAVLRYLHRRLAAGA